MAQGIFLHKYDVDGKLYDGDVTTLNNKLQSGAEVDAKITALSLDTMSTQAADSVNISGGAIAGITDLAVADGGTGASSAGAARTNLGVAIGSDVQAYGAKLDALSALAVTDSGFIVGNGSTFVLETGATARTSLGVDAAGTDNSTDVTVTGKDYASISGQEITFAQIDLTDDVTDALPIANGGTGATSKSAAQQALDLEPGVDVQAYDAELAALAGLTSAANKIPMFSGSGAATVIDFLDEDGLSSNSATAVPSQQSVKAFVEAQVQGLDIKDSVRLASTANFASTYSSGVLTASSAGVLTIDGGNVALNDRILLKDQSTGSQNGIYKCTTAGASGLNTQPNTSSAYTGGDASYGSSSSISGITLSTQTFSGSSFVLQYSNYSGSSVSIAAGDAIIVSDGSDTVAVAASSAHTLNNGGSGTISFSGGGTIAAYSNASSVSVDSSSTMAIRAQNYGSLISLFPNDTINSAYSSVSLTSAWGGSTIPAGKYIRFRNYANNAWYYVVTADLENGDTTLSMAFDSDDSHDTNPAFYGGSTTDFAMFDGQTPGSGTAAVLTRATDFDSDADISAGAFCFVEEGTASADAGFVLSTNEPITLDTTALAFTQFSGAGSITAGTGLTKSGNTIAATGGLADIAGLAKTDGGIIVGDGSNFVLESGATARTSLGAQTLHANLTDISGLAVTDGGIIVGDGSNFVLESGATARTSLGVSIGSDVQAYDAQLDTLSGFTAAQVTRGIADDNLLTVDDADAADNDYAKFTANGIEGRSFSEVKTDLGLVIGTDVQAYDAQLDTLSGFSAAQVTRGIADDNLITADCASHAIANGDFAKFTANGVEGREPSQVRSDLSLVPGTDVQAYDAELAAIAGLTSAANKGIMFDGSESATTFDLTAAGRALLDDADAAAMRSTLGLVIGTDVAAADSSELSVNTAEPSSIAIANVNGMYVYDLSSSSSHTVTLPSTATAGCLGKSIIFKVKSTVNSQTLTINPASSQTIDGESSIVLNQERQSIRLVVSEEYSSGAAVQCWVVV